MLVINLGTRGKAKGQEVLGALEIEVEEVKTLMKTEVKEKA